MWVFSTSKQRSKHMLKLCWWNMSTKHSWHNLADLVLNHNLKLLVFRDVPTLKFWHLGFTKAWFYIYFFINTHLIISTHVYSTVLLYMYVSIYIYSSICLYIFILKFKCSDSEFVSVAVYSVAKVIARITHSCLNKKKSTIQSSAVMWIIIITHLLITSFRALKDTLQREN